jgi:hypothetical protein
MVDLSGNLYNKLETPTRTQEDNIKINIKELKRALDLYAAE